MTAGLLLPRILAVILGGLLALLGAFVLLISLGPLGADPSSAQGLLDIAIGIAFLTLPLCIIWSAFRTRSAGAAWLCVGGILGVFGLSFTTLFL